MKPSRIFPACALVVALLVPVESFGERAPDSNERAIDDPRVQHRTYTFDDGEEIPYAMFVPSTYDGSTAYPLMVSLHGLTRQYDWLMGYHGFLDFAERDGYIVVSPLGYVRDGWYGSRTNHKFAGESELDVMNVLGLVRDELNVDDRRIYLWGHSMGGAGTYHLAQKYPDIWAGLGVAAPAPLSSSDALESFAHIPIIALCGDQDRLVTPMRQWVAKMGELGMQHVYVEIPGGDHSLFISQNADTLEKLFHFFNIVRKPLDDSAIARQVTRKPFLQNPFVFGTHRGGAFWRPESTAKTYLEGSRLYQIAMQETDVRMTKDGEVVVLHDETVDRTTNGSGAIADLTLAEAQALDAGYKFTTDDGESFPYRGAGYRIPTFRDVLRLLPDQRFLVELKPQEGIADSAVKVILEEQAVDRVLLASFDPALMAQAKEMAPGIARCFNSESRPRLIEALRGDDWEAYVPEDDVFVMNYRRMASYGITAADIPVLRAKGIPVLAYSLNRADQISEALDMGIASMLTDRPDVFAEVLAGR